MDDRTLQLIQTVSVLGLQIGEYRLLDTAVDSCSNQVAIDRPNITASPDQSDLFGARQLSAIENHFAPVYARALAKTHPS